MTTHSTIYVGENTHILEVVNLMDHLDAVQTDATVTVTAIVDSAGSAVSGVTVPITLNHVSAGLYRATLPHGGGFTAGRKYRATFKAVGSQGFRGEWVETLIAKVRAA
jgi:hypothetical protein